MLIENLLDVNLLHKHVENKLVTVQPNRWWKNIKIYNYGRKCHYDPTLWDSVTEQCRGLIVDWDTGEVIARPFRKFFNLGTSYRPETAREKLPILEPEVTKKMDGSLGVLWQYNNEPYIATRGSFGSAQARWATNYYKANYGNDWPNGWTPLFEIIYPENRIVVKYEREEMVLLGMVNIETGEEMPHRQLSEWAAKNHVPVVQLYNGKKLEELALEDVPNEEGYVLTWHLGNQSPIKVKVKFIEYMRIHRLVTGLSPKAIWEMLREGQNLEEEFADMPEHFKQWADGHIDKLLGNYMDIEKQVNAVWSSRPSSDDRKELALYFTKHPSPIPSACFARLDGKDESESIWKACRPKPEDAFDAAVVEV